MELWMNYFLLKTIVALVISVGCFADDSEITIRKEEEGNERSANVYGIRREDGCLVEIGYLKALGGDFIYISSECDLTMGEYSKSVKAILLSNHFKEKLGLIESVYFTGVPMSSSLNNMGNVYKLAEASPRWRIATRKNSKAYGGCNRQALLDLYAKTKYFTPLIEMFNEVGFSVVPIEARDIEECSVVAREVLAKVYPGIPISRKIDWYPAQSMYMNIRLERRN